MLHNYAEKNYDAVISLPLDVYPLEIIYVAAYDLIDDLYFYLFRDKAPSRDVKVAVKTKPGGAENLETLVGLFENELIRQALRSESAKLNREIRSHIIGRTLASALPGKEPPVDAE